MQIKKINYEDKKFKEKFIDSLKETGFAIISNTPISEKKVKECQDLWRIFFKKDLKYKMNFLFDKENQSGYFPFKSENAKTEKNADLKEFFHIFDKTQNPIENEKVWEMRTELMNLALNFLDMIQEDLDINLPNMRESVENHNLRTLFRVIYYPELKGNEKGTRAAAHEDINLITLLPAQSSPGLEAKDSDGNWIEVEYEVGDLVVNIGDMLQMLSNHKYISTTHRVKNIKNGKDRISMPLFVHPNEDFNLGELSAGDYLNKRLKEIGLKK